MTLNIFDIVWFSFLWNFNTREKKTSVNMLNVNVLQTTSPKY